MGFITNWRRIAVFAILGASGVVWWAGSYALKAEERLIAVVSTVLLVEDYVKNERRWPSSWESPYLLESVKIPYSEKDSRIKLRQFAKIDFNASINDAASATPENFPLIQPIGPCSKSYEIQVSHLIETAKALRRER